MLEKAKRKDYQRRMQKQDAEKMKRLLRNKITALIDAKYKEEEEMDV